MSQNKIKIAPLKRPSRETRQTQIIQAQGLAMQKLNSGLQIQNG